MNDHHKEAVMHRLSSIAGHVKSVERMINDDEYCIDIIKQTQAIQAALSKVSQLVLDRHLRSCVSAAIRGDEPSERERVLEEILDVYHVASK